MFAAVQLTPIMTLRERNHRVLRSGTFQTHYKNQNRKFVIRGRDRHRFLLINDKTIQAGVAVPVSVGVSNLAVRCLEITKPIAFGQNEILAKTCCSSTATIDT